MENEKQKSVHIHTGWLIIFIILIIILFKIDIKSKIQSPMFQRNVTFIEESVKSFYSNKIKEPLNNFIKNFFIDLKNRGIEEVKEGVNNKLDKFN